MMRTTTIGLATVTAVALLSGCAGMCGARGSSVAAADDDRTLSQRADEAEIAAMEAQRQADEAKASADENERNLDKAFEKSQQK
jgi:hypothetical protein